MSCADWPAYVTEFHTRRPGVTEQVLRRARAVDGDVYDWVAAAVPTRATVLDLACGNAPLWTRLPGRGYVGVDRNAAELAATRARGVPALIRADAAAMPAAGASVDAVACSMALQILAPLPGVLAEVGRVLRPGRAAGRHHPRPRPTGHHRPAGPRRGARHARPPARLPQRSVPVPPAIDPHRGRAARGRRRVLLLPVPASRRRRRGPVPGLAVPARAAPVRHRAARTHLRALARTRIGLPIPIRRITARAPGVAADPHP